MNRIPAAADSPGYWMTGCEASELGSPSCHEVQQIIGFAANLGEIRPFDQNHAGFRSGRQFRPARIVAGSAGVGYHAAAGLVVRLRRR
jgi:hypothetical protein